MTKVLLHIPLLVGLLLVPAPAWADFQAGVDAYDRGDYETAIKEWRPLAEQGYAYAQNNLGLMYAEGQGVPQDYQEAMKWYRLAAEQGHTRALMILGDMYRSGQGVSQDYEKAVQWYRRAAEQGFTRYFLHLKSLLLLGKFNRKYLLAFYPVWSTFS